MCRCARWATLGQSPGALDDGVVERTATDDRRRAPVDRGEDRQLARLFAETRRYLDDAEAALAAHDTADAFFRAMLDRYPDHLGPTVLWVSSRALYLAREGGDPVQNLVAAWRR